MVTDLKHNSRRQRRFLLLFILFLWTVVASFVIMQYGHEHSYKAELLDARLQQVNFAFAESLRSGSSAEEFYDKTVCKFPDIRLTLIASDGTVTYDSFEQDSAATMSNHLTRKEVAEALADGHGYTVRRLSESTAEEYFYSATAADSIVIRSALPYSVSLRRTLGSGYGFLWFMVAVSILIGAAGIVVLQRMRQTDVALAEEQQRTEFEQQEKIRIKKQLTNNINHELKTPVSAIRGCLETIIDNPDMDSAARENFIGKSYKQTQRLENLLHDVATITRMDEAPEMIGRESLSLSALIGEVVDEAKTAYAASPMRINLSLPDKPLTVIGNDTLLRGIFRNLIDNAESYSGGRDIFITFLGSTEEGACKFSVADNGIGVEEEHLPHLFERFYRVDTGRSRKMGGTGLGLSIVRNAVAIHGGEIEVGNRAEGGLEFIFTIAPDGDLSHS